MSDKIRAMTGNLVKVSSKLNHEVLQGNKAIHQQRIASSFPKGKVLLEWF